MSVKELRQVRDPVDGKVLREYLIDKEITEAAENPWIGQLTAVDHDKGAEDIALRANLAFELVTSSMLTVPGRRFAPGDTLTSDDLLLLQVASHVGKAVSRSDTLEVIGCTGLREVVVPPLQSLEFFWEISEKLGFRIEAAGSTYENSVLCAFARHQSHVTHLGANRFIRYLCFMTAFGAGCTPTLIHASFHPISGKLLPVDAQKIGARKTRAVQTAKRSVLGTDRTFSRFSTDKLEQDWFSYSETLRKLSERQLSPLEVQKVLTMSLGRSFSNAIVMQKLARDVRASCRDYPRYRRAIASRMNHYQKSHVLSTPETICSALGAFLFGCLAQYPHKKLMQSSMSYATEIGPSGMTKKRTVFTAAREMLL